MLKKKKKTIWIILGVLGCFNILAWVGVYELSQPQFLEIIFFDVGQGDAIWIETLQRHQILIDGGPNSTVLEKLAQEIPFYDKTIDLIILTHPETDHMTGLIEVLKRYKVKNILWTGVKKETGVFKEWLEAIEKEGAEIIIAQAGQKIRISRPRDVVPGIPGTTSRESYFKIINPQKNLAGQEFKNSNNTSIVSQLTFGENSFLFTGDIYKDKENDLVEKYNLDSDILKISHHGSKTSTSQEFLSEVSPGIAVITVGKDNRYGHPYPEVLEKLEGIEVLRTDIDGDIKFICGAENCLVKTDY